MIKNYIFLARTRVRAYVHARVRVYIRIENSILKTKKDA